MALKHVVDNYDTMKTQANLSAEILALSKRSIIDGVILKDIRVNTDITVNHTLGRDYVGFIVISRNNSASVWNNRTIDANLVGKSIRLQSTADTTISIWVF